MLHRLSTHVELRRELCDQPVDLVSAAGAQTLFQSGDQQLLRHEDCCRERVGLNLFFVSPFSCAGVSLLDCDGAAAKRLVEKQIALVTQLPVTNLVCDREPLSSVGVARIHSDDHLAILANECPGKLLPEWLESDFGSQGLGYFQNIDRRHRDFAGLQNPIRYFLNLRVNHCPPYFDSFSALWTTEATHWAVPAGKSPLCVSSFCKRAPAST